jgi:hypothetical protein
MFTLTFIRPIDLGAPLNINGSFYNTRIIKQNNMTYQHKIIFCSPYEPFLFIKFNEKHFLLALYELEVTHYINNCIPSDLCYKKTVYFLVSSKN